MSMDSFKPMASIRFLIYVQGREGLPIDKSFPTTALDNLSPSALVAGENADETTAAKKAEVFGTTGQGTLVRKKYRVDFAGKNFQRYCVFAACSFPLKL
ncbi:hypothetical protein BDF20DRAFT_246460 [Mycotypha africana]|uniref:uncharacterized protein n=1 Tax=Mycotypha africana TaxID=64632 RepID=UPI002301EDC3|nr:uncharacterized protein BDF20DRAFT_246460 [Mycotypha africana]KAI8967162.1 hypothetical protein BDF20DRAFT_246460 [Mycotypha africana]